MKRIVINVEDANNAAHLASEIDKLLQVYRIFRSSEPLEVKVYDVPAVQFVPVNPINPT